VSRPTSGDSRRSVRLLVRPSSAHVGSRLSPSYVSLALLVGAARTYD
jgi:hypothetical protein